ncbi:hypothetical protein GCK32_014753 [Trichostrongylus colubriformis]|uniref:Uncharacterized protein n=1 Tax=Trichostrongylus colubriformis TaxID=6319 RepID=A0AAN8FJD0_TRICO
MRLIVLTILIGVVHSTPSLVCDGFREQMVADFSDNLPIKTLLRRNIRNLQETDCVFFFRTTDIYNQAEAYPFLVELQDKTFVYGSVSVDYRFHWIWNMLEVGDFDKDLRKCVANFNVDRMAKRTRALRCKRRTNRYKCKGFESHKFKDLPQNPPIKGVLQKYIGNINENDCVLYYRAKVDRDLPFFPFFVQLQNKTAVYGKVTVDYKYHWSWQMSETKYFEKDLEMCSADFETVAKRGLSCSHTSKVSDHSIFVIKKLRHDTITF